MIRYMSQYITLCTCVMCIHFGHTCICKFQVQLYCVLLAVLWVLCSIIITEYSLGYRYLHIIMQVLHKWRYINIYYNILVLYVGKCIEFHLRE